MNIRGLLEEAGRGLVLAFIVMIIVAAIYLALGIEDKANKSAEIGYYFLVGGVVLMLASIVGSSDENNVDKKESADGVE